MTWRGHLLRVLAVAALSSAEPVAAAVSDFVVARRGSLPILVTAPHGGEQRPPDVPSRRELCDRDRQDSIVCRGDEHTDEIALRVAAAIERLSGQSPFIVVARFHREFVDANRSPAAAYIGSAGEPYYRAYHDRAGAFVREIVESHGRGLLIDLHGCCKRRSGVRNPDALYRGTRKGRSVAALVARHGIAAVTGPRSVFGQLRGFGYQVWPDLSLDLARETLLQGGYTLERYGSHNGGLDALQIEVGWNLRREPSARARLADDLGRAVAVFYDAYLK